VAAMACVAAAAMGLAPKCDGPEKLGADTM